MGPVESDRLATTVLFGDFYKAYHNNRKSQESLTNGVLTVQFDYNPVSPSVLVVFNNTSVVREVGFRVRSTDGWPPQALLCPTVMYDNWARHLRAEIVEGFTHLVRKHASQVSVDLSGDYSWDL